MTKTNLITGFLGSGKTTSILHLLAHKPADEKWAVLINEFGEVGIDGALLADSGALLKEIPGGCMCCVNGLPMQVGLNTLLRQGKPDRLLIEPTGLGHPKQILDILTAAVYEPWIDLRATLCVLDPRQLLDSKVMANDNFRDQLAAADVIISNKTDRMTAESEQAFDAWWQEHAGERLHIGATHGNIDPKLLDLPRRNLTPLPESAEHAHSHGQKKRSGRAQPAGPPTLATEPQQRSGLPACGWIFDADTTFDTIGLLEWARLAPVARVKGVMRIAEGLVRINRQGLDLHIETQNVAPPDSRIELITESEADWNALQASLLKLRLG